MKEAVKQPNKILILFRTRNHNMLILSYYNAFDSRFAPPKSYLRSQTLPYSSSYTSSSLAKLTLKTLAACFSLQLLAFLPLPHVSFDPPPPSSHSPAFLAASLPCPPLFLRVSGFDLRLCAIFRRAIQQTNETLDGAAMDWAIVGACDNRRDSDVYGANDANDAMDASGDAIRCESDFDHDASEVRRSGFDCVDAKCVWIVSCDAAVWKCSCHSRSNRSNRSNRFGDLFVNALFRWIWALLGGV